ncbi:hypothetical protein AeMF1_014491 [Aphanomyces euteiches]|nr:hypothetical protein AeMF1_014491 [Aphanomyces euteiches]KAH9196828.1 hypothetical protein AeNC1_001209 [Aphanomyces euteiches]
MTFSLSDIPDQTRRVAIVTGGTAGLGLQSVIELARKGCHVIFTARSPARGQEALDKVQAALAPSSFKVEFAIAENEDLTSIVRFADWVIARNLPLHVLLLNAGGGLAPYRAIHGVDSALFINHVAHHLLATRLLSVLERSAPSRVVVISSLAHSGVKTLDLDLPEKDQYDTVKAYGISKTAQLLMARGLMQQVGSAKVFVNSLHPGMVVTEVINRPIEFPHLPWFLRSIAVSLFKIVTKLFGTTPAKGVLTHMYVATSPDIENNDWRGQYFSPVAKLDKSSPLSENQDEVERLWKWTTAVIDRVLAESKI